MFKWARKKIRTYKRFKRRVGKAAGFVEDATKGASRVGGAAGGMAFAGGKGMMAGGMAGAGVARRVVRAQSQRRRGVSVQEANRARMYSRGALQHYEPSNHYTPPLEHQRVAIPREVKLAVWHRDGGRCAVCGSTLDLQFDHVLASSRGGSSTNPNNVQLLCGEHNRHKSARIQ